MGEPAKPAAAQPEAEVVGRSPRPHQGRRLQWVLRGAPLSCLGMGGPCWHEKARDDKPLWPWPPHQAGSALLPVRELCGRRV